MRSERAALTRIVESVADGTAEIDWAALEANLESEQDRQLLRQLRVLARISDLHRSLSDDSVAAPSDASGGDTSLSKVIGRIAPQTLPPMPAPAGNGPPLPGDVPARWGRLEIRERVGYGTFGEVYRAFDTQLHREVALKLLRPGNSPARLGERVLREGRILARIRHPNVVDVYGAESSEGRVGLWMEYVRGATLEERLRQQGAFSAREAALIGQDLCRAVAAVHAAGLVHRDIKCHNVMREEGGRVVLMDFGAGQYRAESAQGTVRLTGTPLYLAPEVLAGGEATPASDIYSIGVLLYRLVTNDYPVAGTTVEELRAAHAQGRGKRLHDVRPDLPDSYVQVVEQAIERDPARRFATVGELHAALGDTHALTRVTPPVGGNWRPWAAAAIMAIAAAVVLFWPFRSPPSGVPAATPANTLAVVTAPSPGADRESQQLLEGLAGELMGQLSSIGAVTLRDSVSAQPTSASAFRELSERLGVTYLVVLGSEHPRLAAGLAAPVGTDAAIRFSVRLVKGGEVAWAQTYTGELNEAFSMQRRVAGDIADQIRVKVAGPAYTLTRFDQDAQQLYFQARRLAETRRKAQLQQAVALYQRAIDRDASFAPAYAGLSLAYSSLRGSFGALPAADAIAGARAAAEQAVALAPDRADGHTALAWASFYLAWDWRRAESEFQRSLELAPGDALTRYFYADYLNAMGRFAEAEAQNRRAFDANRQSVFLRRGLAWSYFFARRFADAEHELQVLAALDPGAIPVRTLLARTWIETSRADQAVHTLSSVIATEGEEAYLEMLGDAYAAAGNRDAATQVLARLGALAERQYVKPYAMALIHTRLGEYDAALALLERAYRERDSTLVNLGVDPRLDVLRDLPRFKTLRQRLQL